MSAPAEPVNSRDPGDAGEAETTRNLDRSFARSLAWAGAGRWLTQMISWPATILIARLLSPEDYGVVVLVRVYIDFIGLLTEAGLGAAVTIAPEMDDRRAGQLHTLSLMMGLVAVAIAWTFAIPLRNWYQRPGLEWVIVALSSIFIIESVGVVPNGLLRREFRYKDIAIADWVRTAADLSVEITLAVLGFGYWTLVAGYLAGALAWQTVVFTRRNPGFRRPHLVDVRDTLRTMAHMVANGLSWFAVTRSDLIIGGRLFTTGVVGFYTFANQLATIPSQKITLIVANVTPALFRRVRTELPLLRRYVLLVSEALSVIVLPAFVGIVLVAHDFTAAALGSKWMGIVVPLQLLALHAAFQATVMPFQQVLWATDNKHIVTRYGIASVFILPPLLYLGAKAFGVNGLAAAWLIGSPLVDLPRARAALRVMQLPAWEYLRSLWPATSGSLVMTGAVLAVQHLPALADRMPVLARLGLTVVVGAVSYAATLWVLHGDRVRGVLTTVRELRRKS